MFCRGQHVEAPEYVLVDASRLKLKCGHFSEHIQCVITSIGLPLCGPDEVTEASCPIQDTPACRQHLLEIKQGPLRYWGKQDYHAFFKAFLRNQTLVDAFVDPAYFTPTTPFLQSKFDSWAESI